MPVNNAQQTVPQLTLTLPRWGNDLHQGRFAVNTPYRVRLEFVGDQIESGYNRRLRIDLPRCILIDHTPDLGDNIEQTLQFNCYQAPSTPAGFSSADYLRIDTRNEVASDIMA